MYPAALHKTPTQTVDSSWDRDTNSNLEQICPKQEQVFFS